MPVTREPSSPVTASSPPSLAQNSPAGVTTAKHVALFVDTSSVGGIERHVATLAADLQARGVPVEVLIYANYGANPWIAQLDRLGVAYRFLPGTVPGLLRELQAKPPAVLHTHGYKAGILGRFAATLLRIPAVSTYHSGEKAKFPVGAYYLLDDWTGGFARAIAVSDTIRARLPFGATVIPNFIPLPAAPPDCPLPRRIAFVGRLSHEKAPDLFCEMARASSPGLEWHVYGDGPMRSDLEREYGSQVTFHGIVTDLTSVWPSVGALLMPSRHEGLPLAALEALGAGVPVIASAVGGVPRVVIPGTTGWLFPASDTAAGLAAIDAWRALDEQSQRTLRKTCFDHVRLNFSSEAHVPRILDVYRAAGL